MDELKILIDLVRELPALALWVLVGFYAYKVVVIGSIYGVIRFSIEKLHDWKTRPPAPQIVQFRIGGAVISEDVAAGLQAQLARLASRSGYFHAEGIAKLRKAIDVIEAEDRAEEAAREARLAAMKGAS